MPHPKGWIGFLNDLFYGLSYIPAPGELSIPFVVDEKPNLGPEIYFPLALSFDQQIILRLSTDSAPVSAACWSPGNLARTVLNA